MKLWQKLFLGLVACMLLVVNQGIASELPLNTVRIHYHRDAGDYEGWGLHLWGDDLALTHVVSWRFPMLISGRDDFGVYYDVPVIDKAKGFGFIIHRGKEKNVKQDMVLNVARDGFEVWQLQGDPRLYSSDPLIALAKAKADKAKADKLKAEKAKADKLKADKAKADKLKADKLKAEKAKADKLKAEKAEKDRIAEQPVDEGRVLSLLETLRKDNEVRVAEKEASLQRLRKQLAAESAARKKAEKALAESQGGVGETSGELAAELEIAQTRERELNERVTALQTELNKLIQISKRAAPLQAAESKQRWFDWLSHTTVILLTIILLVFVTIYRRQRGELVKKMLAQKAELVSAQEKISRDTEERQQVENKMIAMAGVDELTGLPNRSIFNRSLQRSVAKASRSNRKMALLFIDLDRFKLINDTLGHDYGDQVLRTVSERFRECIREVDMLARLGGDEFVLMIEDLVDPKFLAGVATKMISAAQQPFFMAGQEYHVTASIGIATYPKDAKDASALLKHADIAMYRAKDAGKNTYQFFSEQMNIHSLQQLALESSLRSSIEREELLLHYQPIVDAKVGRITALEALLRWQHPDMGLVGPMQFIPIAEESGLIVPIGHWVLQTACQQGQAWHQAGYDIALTVNLSPRQLIEPDIVASIEDILSKTGFPAEYLTLEITEDLMMSNPEETVERIEDLRQLGIKFAVDDFGTGYSSLSYLKKFPIDTLKVDRSFLQGVPDDSDDSAITSAIVAMGKNLRLNVIAEGVETSEQCDFLLKQGCRLMQGYAFAKPQPAEEVSSLLDGTVGTFQVLAS
ncbi:EAL domain-containing protein [Corallincola holothuriorum]|uniref:cyclic-guanylate-specific phosphodiesterase n=1 Tax=Corallincola holothuriorum TaxID=2282215 RepID=A0A368NJQ9_9GAMM|nr:EAL domain-containing protein [Corallincola holothuriorum]RCU50005.1 EAL domain-containing protein [Corallincola holothuriorum]